MLREIYEEENCARVYIQTLSLGCYKFKDYVVSYILVYVLLCQQISHILWN